MPTIQTAELRARVAKHLNIAGYDRELDAERAAEIDEKIGDVTALLREQEIAWWPDDLIPLQCALPLTIIVSAYAAPSVGKAGQGYEGALDGGLMQLLALKETAQNAAIEIDYF